MSVASKTHRIRWDEGKADELWEFVQRETAKGNKVTSALREFAADNGISWLTARWKYYRVKNERLQSEERDDPAPEEREQSESEQGGSHVLDHLTGFLRHGQGTGLDLEGFFAGLHLLARQAEQAQSLEEELQGLREKLEAEKKQCQKLEDKLEQVKEQYQTLNYLTQDWLNLQSVDRVTTMGDFGRKLQYEVDRFGTVIRVEG